MSATTQGGFESDTAASKMAAVVAQAISAVDWDSEQLPEELASAVSSSAAHVALQSYEDRIQAGLSTVRANAPTEVVPVFPLAVAPGICAAVLSECIACHCRLQASDCINCCSAHRMSVCCAT